MKEWDVKKMKRDLAITDEGGQSILEFILTLPLMLGLVVLLLRINTTIQMSIVNQKYTRGMAQWFVFNSAVFPEVKVRRNDFVNPGAGATFNQMIIGVSENRPSKEDPGAEASKFRIVRRAKDNKESEAGEEPEELTEVRVRNTLSICTQSNVIQGKQGPVTSGLEGGSIGLYEGMSPGAFKLCFAPIMNQGGKP